MLGATRRPVPAENLKSPYPIVILLPLLSAYQLLCQRAVWGQHLHDYLSLQAPLRSDNALPALRLTLNLELGYICHSPGLSALQ